MEEQQKNNDKFDYKSLSLPKQYLWRLCKRIMKELKENSCSDDEVEEVLAGIEAKSLRYINPDDYITADEAMKILGMARNKFFEYAKIYHLESKKINNRTIGYYRGDIYDLLEKIKKKQRL